MLLVDRSGLAVDVLVVVEGTRTEVAPVVPVAVAVGADEDEVEDSAVGCGAFAPQAARPRRPLRAAITMARGAVLRMGVSPFSRNLIVLRTLVSMTRRGFPSPPIWTPPAFGRSVCLCRAVGPLT